ncbi:MAG: class I SAM-dependent methyltransferase [Nocardioidaceae bacterium]|nr:class I SAM-dependent methyltransferase [Nocardioidaceae bacterium]NUS53144.1 class I SAM-dependent methyltransferase [Nocardioidaceae bacterium]
MAVTDWRAWHRDYDDPGSDLSRRRRSVQASIEAWLDSRDDETLTVASACSGDGRDLLGVLARRPDAGRVRARLLELDDVLAGEAERYAAACGLDRVDVRRADAGRTASYAGTVPADLVMMCGVFGNVTDDDLRRTVATLPRLCSPGATVLWTRGRFREGDLTSTIRGWFAEEGFDEVSFDAPDDTSYRVGAQRLARDPEPLGPDETFFTFTR